VALVPVVQVALVKIVGVVTASNCDGTAAGTVGVTVAVLRGV
jgi:hypothetical protein